LNEVGTRDIWPAIAENVTFVYGSAGTFGFRRPLTYDRWHNGAAHGFFLSRRFCSKYWVPFLKDGKIVPDAPDPERPQFYLSIIKYFKLKIVIPVVFGLSLVSLPQDIFQYIGMSSQTVIASLPPPPLATAPASQPLPAAAAGPSPPASILNLENQQECNGLPGETAWIYAGGIDRVKQRFNLEPFFVREGGNLPSVEIKSGEWIRLTTNRKTMILNYKKQGVALAMFNPFLMGYNIDYTCRDLPAGQRLYVADVKIDGPSLNESHMWIRIRYTLPGG
jgi:hypothetical protein